MIDDLVIVQAHCSGANIGPGFDNAAVAYEHLFLTATGKLQKKKGLEIKFTGDYGFPTESPNSRPRKVYDAMASRFPDIAREGVLFMFRNDIRDGGLGTSGANCSEAVEILNYLFKLNLSNQQKAEYAAIGEPGHSDNVNASIHGGVVFTKEYNVSPGSSDFEPISIPGSLVPVVVIPKHIIKDGGTAAARGINPEWNTEPSFRNELYLLLRKGFEDNDFNAIKYAIDAYSDWEKSVTYLRDKNRIYKIDFAGFRRNLEEAVGTEAVVTPSGAGPVMLILAKDNDVASRAKIQAISYYSNMGHPVDVVVTSFLNSNSRVIG